MPVMARVPGAVRDPASNSTAASTSFVPAAAPALWTAAYGLVLGVVHLFFLSSFMMVAALPLYIAKAPRWEIGLVVGVPFIASMVLRPFTGRMVDRSGRRIFLVIGGAGCAITLALHAVSTDIWFLTVLRLFFGAAQAFITTAIMAALADVLPVRRRGEGMGWYGVVYTSTNLYGPGLGLWLATTFGYTVLFGFSAVLNVGCVVLAILLVETGLRRSAGRAPAKLFSRSALLPMVTFLAVTIPAGAITAFLALVEKQRHAGDPGVFFILFGITLVVGRIGGGWLADRISRPAAIVPGLVLTGIAMLALSASSTAWAFYLVALVYGLGFALCHTGATILTMDRAPESERGAAMATLVVAWDIGTVLGAFVLGFLADAAGYGQVFLLVGLIPLIQAGVFIALVRGQRAGRVAA